MKVISQSPERKNNGFNRYLKPGALAKIRNSRINTRSNSLLTLSLPDRVDSPSPSTDNLVPQEPPQTPTIDQMPDLLNKMYGPYRIGRKKLGPARSVLRTMMNLNPSPNTIVESSNSNNNDVVVSH